MLSLSNHAKKEVRGVIKSYKPMGDVTLEQWKKMTPDERRKIERLRMPIGKDKIEAVLTPEQRESMSMNLRIESQGWSVYHDTACSLIEAGRFLMFF